MEGQARSTSIWHSLICRRFRPSIAHDEVMLTIDTRSEVHRYCDRHSSSFPFADPTDLSSSYPDVS